MKITKGLAGMLMVPLLILQACGGLSSEIHQREIDERSDVFQEAGKEEKPSRDTVGLAIKAQLKTHLEGFYILESKNSLHGKPTYPFLLNIDGQHVLWQMDGKKEMTSYFDANGKWTIEGGPGMRYALEKKIRIAPGVHRVFIALPGDDFTKQFEIQLVKGNSTCLN